ncbi:MAG: hypothetical protein N3A65_03725 [candidate division WOR-3 bacterium]|nr:hypothetical protein [candidate division WOR-3 bacterium]
MALLEPLYLLKRPVPPPTGKDTAGNSNGATYIFGYNPITFYRIECKPNTFEDDDKMCIDNL